MLEGNKINETLTELEEELTQIKTASEMISDAKETAENTINETKEILSELIEQSEKSSNTAIKESKKLNKTTTSLVKNVDTLMGKLDKVDFPIRLDKIDNSVTSINVGIQNIQNRIDSVENNIKKDFDNKMDKILVKLKNSQRINNFFLGVIIIFVVLMTFKYAGIL